MARDSLTLLTENVTLNPELQLGRDKLSRALFRNA